MITYIALLRGINVGGNKIIKMQELKAMFQSLQFNNVRTYIQSGNVVFESGEVSSSRVGEVIEQEIKATFGFDVSVMIRTLEELERTLANNPFNLSNEVDFKRLYVSFLAAEPSADSLEKLHPYENGADKLRIVGKELYVLYEISVSKSALFKVSMDKLLGMPVTARNWNTVNKLVEMGRSV
jgi:uncharacterized protein (DUF1697 family)